MSNYFFNIEDVSTVFSQIHFYDKAYSLSDTGVNHRLITYWDEKGLLGQKNKDGEWRKFTFPELIWIRIVAKLRKFNVGIQTIIEIKNELEKTINLREIKSNPLGKDIIDKIISSNNLESDFLQKQIKKLKSEPEEFTLSYFHAFLTQVVLEKQNTSVIIAFKDSIESAEFNRSDSEIWITLYNPNKIQELSQTKEYFEIFNKTHLSISFNEIIDSSIIHINPEKLPSALVSLNADELKIFKLIRSGTYKSINIKFNNKKEPEILELSEIKELKIESRLLEMIHNGGYQDIEIKTQAGKIFYCKNTKKIKLK